MNSSETPAADPATIEREIAHTRAALQRKLEALQHRLNPRERLMEEAGRVRSAVSQAGQDSYASIAAVAAIGVGTLMAVRGLRNRNHKRLELTADDFMGE